MTKRECDCENLCLEPCTKRRQVSDSSSLSPSEEKKRYYYFSLCRKDGSVFWYCIPDDPDLHPQPQPQKEEEEIKKMITPNFVMCNRNWKLYSTVAIGSKIYFIGGEISDSSGIIVAPKTMEYDIKRGIWRELVSTGFCKILPSVVALHGKIYIVGSNDNHTIWYHHLNDDDPVAISFDPSCERPEDMVRIYNNPPHLYDTVVGSICAVDPITNVIASILELNMTYTSFHLLDPYSSGPDIWGSKASLVIPRAHDPKRNLYQYLSPPGSKFFVMVDKTIVMYIYPFLYATHIDSIEPIEPEGYASLIKLDKVLGDFEDYTVSAQLGVPIFLFHRELNEYCFVWSTELKDEFNTKVHCLFFKIDCIGNREEGPWKASCHRTDTYTTKECGGVLRDCLPVNH